MPLGSPPSRMKPPASCGLCGTTKKIHSYNAARTGYYVQGQALLCDRCDLTPEQPLPRSGYAS